MTVVVLAFCFGFGYRANHIVSYESLYMTPKILSVSPSTTKEHPYKVKKKLLGSFFIIHLFSIFDFFINHEKTALQIFFSCHPKYARKVSGLLRNRPLAPIVQ